jgi:ComF family protein
VHNSFECSNCSPLDLQFRYARSIIAAKGVGLELIHRYKYQRALWFDPLFAELLADHARPQLAPSDWDVIVPVPLHPLKHREREFNQAERLADHLGRATGLPVDRGALRRISCTRTQTTLTRSERAANVRHAFEAARPLPCGRRRVILIDDVLTTGSTLSECARALRCAGAADVCAWTLARGL